MKDSVYLEPFPSMSYDSVYDNLRITKRDHVSVLFSTLTVYVVLFNFYILCCVSWATVLAIMSSYSNVRKSLHLSDSAEHVFFSKSVLTYALFLRLYVKFRSYLFPSSPDYYEHHLQKQEIMESVIFWRSADQRRCIFRALIRQLDYL